MLGFEFGNVFFPLIVRKQSQSKQYEGKKAYFAPLLTDLHRSLLGATMGRILPRPRELRLIQLVLASLTILECDSIQEGSHSEVA